MKVNRSLGIETGRSRFTRGLHPYDFNKKPGAAVLLKWGVTLPETYIKHKKQNCASMPGESAGFSTMHKMINSQRLSQTQIDSKIVDLVYQV